MSERRFILVDFTYMVRGSSDFMKQAARINYRRPSPTLRLSANSSPNSDQRTGCRRIYFSFQRG
jgi:hypothetical protein